MTVRYEYDPLGQMTRQIVGYGDPQALTTAFAYDDFGQRTETTVGFGTPLARTDRLVYNADGTIRETVQNYQDGVFNAANPDQDVRTEYGYDNLGRQVWVRNALGQVDATHYNAKGQVDWTIRNLSPLVVDAQGQPVFRAFVPAQPDANVATLYAYDGLGRTTLVTETGLLAGSFNLATRTFSDSATRVTRTEYDTLSRPITTTLNYRPELPTGTLPDVNVQTLAKYDEASNLIQQRDTLGRWRYIDYDKLNRPITTTLNYENGNPLTVDAANRSWTDGNDTDIVQVTRYTADGQVDQVIENHVNGVFTQTEPITDRISLYRYDELGRPFEQVSVYDRNQTTATETHRTTTTAYQAVTGRTLGQRDALGRWVSQHYDGLGRVDWSVQNCRDTGGTPISTGCAAFASANADRNIRTETRYDQQGRAFEMVDPLGLVSRSTFDGLGRVTASVRNYLAGGPVDSETNITTRSTYDALGRTLTSTDPGGFVTQTSYDGLNRAVSTTDSSLRVSRQGYDGSGALRWSMGQNNTLSLLTLDRLGRVVASTQNYQDGVVAADEPADRDLIARTSYDAGGRQTANTDAAGCETRYGYDGLNRLVLVTENATSGVCATPPCNVVTRYRYDRGETRTAVLDARGITTHSFVYDAANQIVQQRDGRDRTTGFVYDRGGVWSRRLTRVVPPMV